MAFQIVRNDITRVKADAIVNTANTKPIYGGGTDCAIYEAAGTEQLLAERKKIGDIASGQAVETPAFNLNAKYIIHTVAPIWQGGNNGELDILKSCYENSLLLALKLKCRSIAFPLIAAGVNGFPKDKALKIAMSVIQPFVMDHTMKVILVVFGDEALELSGRVVEKVREYVDANYVETARKKEYAARRNQYGISDRRIQRLLSILDEEKDPYRRSQIERELEKILDRASYTRCSQVMEAERETGVYAKRTDNCLTMEDISPDTEIINSEIPVLGVKPTRKKKVDIDELIAASEKTFQEKLFEIIDERGLTGPQVYKNYISKQVYSKIQADKYYHPNKFTAIALCLSLHLSLEETTDLIGRAGWTLSRSSKADLVVAGCIMNEEYNLVEINILLFDYNCPVLEKIK